MSQANVEIVRRQHDAFNRGDLTAMLELFDPDVEWWDREDDPDATVHRGLDGVRKLLAEFDDLAELRAEPEEFIDAGDYVVVPTRLVGRGRTSGVPFEEHQVQVFQVREGKIIELREYREKDEALKSVGLTG